MTLSSLIGLGREKQKARIIIGSCKRTGEVCQHILLHGIGGNGKTAFARAIGIELGYYFTETHAATFRHASQLHEALIKHSEQAQHLKVPLIFFLDEVHRLSKVLQEALYAPMKEFWIPTIKGKFSIPRFTLIAATTRFDMLDSNSFVTRFSNVWEISRYSSQDISAILSFEFDKMGLKYDSEVIFEISKRCLGVPRIAINLADKIKFTVQSGGSKEITLKDVLDTFELEQIDELGLQPIHHKYLSILSNSLLNGKLVPIGVGAIAAKMRQHEEVIKAIVEPILLELNFISPTCRGRMLTEKGVNFLRKNLTFEPGYSIVGAE